MNLTLKRLRIALIALCICTPSTSTPTVAFGCMAIHQLYRELQGAAVLCAVASVVRKYTHKSDWGILPTYNDDGVQAGTRKDLAFCHLIRIGRAALILAILTKIGSHLVCT